MKSAEFKVLDDKLDHLLEYMDKRFDVVEKRLDEHDEQFRRLNTILDQQSDILNRLDQEHLFVIERFKRVEDQVDQVKLHLHLV